MSLITGHKTILRAISRTDAGVHALEQLAVFDSVKEISTQKIHKSLNALTPKDISITDIIETDPEFNLRKEAQSKTYCYRIHTGVFSPVLEKNYCWLKNKPSAEKMKQLIPLFTGTKNFHAFRASNCGSIYTVKTIHHIEISDEDYHSAKRITILVNGSGFLKNMVRIMVGTMLDFALNKLTYRQIETAFTQNGKRELLGVTAPPEGLTLEKVFTRLPFYQYEKNNVSTTKAGS